MTTILSYKGISPKIHESVYVAPGARIIGDVHVGAYSSIWFNVVIRGDVHYVRIGESTNIQDGSVIHVSSFGHPTIIGHNVTVGHMAMVHACVIEDQCLIGMGSILLDGAVIGAQSIVGAGALVTQRKVFPPGSLILGNPAKWVRFLTDQEKEDLKISAEHYVSVVKNYHSLLG